ncbi:MAG: DUF4198 domain-containing protein [Deltaproteobacteria bacterium]|nr:DUF4198 domain-containing protein [Deltaproteobacteria bacterium]
MTRGKLVLVLTCALCLAWAAPAFAHFGMLIPQTNLLDKPGDLTVDFLFWHPQEGIGMDLVRPQVAGVMVDGVKTDLLPLLEEHKIAGHQAWQVKFPVKKPGDYIFYLEPQPYWEPAEDLYIIHYTKTVVDALGAEEGWDQPVGLKMEIVPLTRPYGLYAGNSFTGRVLYRGKPLADCAVEVEFYNQKAERHAPTEAHITQVVKTTADGVFTWTMPWAGWWGFSALHTDEDRKIKHDGQDKEVEVGGVIWVYAH